MSPALAGGFLTTVPPGKSSGDELLLSAYFEVKIILSSLLAGLI